MSLSLSLLLSWLLCTDANTAAVHSNDRTCDGRRVRCLLFHYHYFATTHTHRLALGCMPLHAAAVVGTIEILILMLRGTTARCIFKDALSQLLMLPETRTRPCACVTDAYVSAFTYRD